MTKEFKEISISDYAQFYEANPGSSFLQSPEWASFMRKRGQIAKILGLYNAGQLVAAAVIKQEKRFGGFQYELHGSPVVITKEMTFAFLESLKSYIKKQKGLLLYLKLENTYQLLDKKGEPIGPSQDDMIDHLLDLGYQQDRQQNQYSVGDLMYHYCKDLSAISADTLSKSYNKNAQRLLKKANHYGVTVRELDRSEISIFHDIQLATSERREYQQRRIDYFTDFYDAFAGKVVYYAAFINFNTYQKRLEKDLETAQNQRDAQQDGSPKAEEAQAKVDKIKAERFKIEELINQYGDQDVPLASNQLIFMPHEAYYNYGGFYPELNAYNGPILLQHQAMLDAIAKKIPVYNFLGVSGRFDGSDGVLRFKQNFNGYIEKKVGNFTYEPYPLKSKAIALVKKVLGRS